MKYRQEPPFSVQIELNEGCNLRCSFCGINGVREKDNQFKFITKKTATTIATALKDAGWTARIEIAMHGEPSLHPDPYSMVKIFRDILPKNQLMMTSNGSGFLKAPGVAKNINSVFDNGLNILVLDDYETVNIVGKIEKELGNIHEDIKVLNYPGNEEGNPHRRYPIKEKRISILSDITVTKTGVHSHLTNHAGSAFPKSDEQAGKRCARPFRELSFRWDGNVALCCHDWRGVYKVGSIMKMTLDELWQSQEFMAARKTLYQGQRVFDPCEGCTERSFRVGFLPDKKGLENLPKPGKKDKEIIQAATSGKPYTKAVLREWEIKKS